MFDLGGVLIELGPSPLPASVLPANRRLEPGDLFGSAASIAFEKGQIGAAGFADALRSELGVDCDSNLLLDHFTYWPVGFFEGACELLQALRPNYQLAILSNTNALHWPRFIDEFGLADFVDHLFASHLLSMSKPEPTIFRHVIDVLGKAPHRILFFDDNAANVEVALGLGLQAFQVRGIGQLRQTLRVQGVIDSDR